MMQAIEGFLKAKKSKVFTQSALDKSTFLKQCLGKTTIFLIATLFVFACSKSKNDPMPPAPTVNDSSVILDTYLALGDSYTIGQSVDSVMRYPAQVAALLAAQNNVFFSGGIKYIATTGWTTFNLEDAIKTATLQPPYSAVTLLIGVNDQHQGSGFENYKTNFSALLDTAISLAGNIKEHVFVLSIPDYSVTPYGGNNAGIAKEIDDFNAANKAITDAHGIAYIDVTEISRRDAGDKSMLSPDNLHPSGKQYAQWAEKLAPVMAAALKP